MRPLGMHSYAVSLHSHAALTGFTYQAALNYVKAPEGMPDFHSAPEQFVLHLHEHLCNDYFYATAPHDRSTCPFAKHRVLPMTDATTVTTSAAPVTQVS